MTKLSVNVNKIATLRNARGGRLPDLKKTVTDIIAFGAQGITVHPRPDERHIKFQDVYDLKILVSDFNASQSDRYIEYNIEGYPSESFIQLMQEVQPDQCTLVPDPPDVITSNAGWNCHENQDFLTSVVDKLTSLSIRSSLFIDPFDFTVEELTALEKISPDRCELYTESFAEAFNTDKLQRSIEAYRLVGLQINELDIELNAGHDLNLENVKYLTQKIPSIKEVSIGHALVCEALYLGLEETVKRYLKELQG